MYHLKRYQGLVITLLFALLPAFIMCLADIRHYVFDTWAVAAFYNTIIILIYLTGCAIIFISLLEILKCGKTLKTKNYVKTSFLLGDANKIVFSPSHGLNDNDILSVYENMDSSIKRRQAQSMAGIMSSANISTMIGLLGTFAGLSMTIASVITLLEKSQISGGSSSDTLSIIVNVVSSLSEPLKGMNTAFVSSIYGVVSSILLNVMCSFVRGEFARLAIDLRDARLDFVRASESMRDAKNGKVKTLRILTTLDDVLEEFKAGMFVFQERLVGLLEQNSGSVQALLHRKNEEMQKRAQFEHSLLDMLQQETSRLQSIENGVSHSVDALAAQDAHLKQLCGLQQDSLNLAQQANDRLAETQNAVGALEKAGDKRHQETLATVQSHLTTFEPLLGQIAGMHNNLQKEVALLKKEQVK